METLYFEDVRVGETITVGDYKLTQKEIISFATKWDPQPYHIDKRVAALSIYGGLTACGIHLMAIRTLLLHQMRPKPIILGSLGWDELRFPNPARVGDRLHLTIKFTYKRSWPQRPDRGIVKSLIKVMNQEDSPTVIERNIIQCEQIESPRNTS
jgi:acyl dehydratase